MKNSASVYAAWMATAVACICFNTAISAQSLGRYGTKKLAKMAVILGIDSGVDTLHTGVYCGYADYKGMPLTVVKRAGRVESIGVSIFDAKAREMMPSPVYNFIERYVLDIMLEGADEAQIRERLKTDRVSFEKGELMMLPTLFADTAVTFSIANHDERAYTVEWQRGAGTVCKMFFPSNYELLHGSRMIENEERLHNDILHTEERDAAGQPVSLSDVERCGNLYILDKGYNSIEAMRNSRYYSLAGNAAREDSLVLICSTRYPVESVANLFSSTDVRNDYTVEVKQLKYNFKSDSYTVKLSQLIGYCLDEGCQPYFGIIGYDSESGAIDAVVEMRNHQEAYEHLMRVRMDTNTLDSRSGVIKVTLTGYVLTHDIKDLYNDKTEKE